MECSQETLLFLPCWYTLNEVQLSDLLQSIGDGHCIVAVMVSVSDDGQLLSYNDSRISRSIIDKQDVIDLLTLHQASQLPFSITVPVTGARTVASSSCVAACSAEANSSESSLLMARTA